jgi:hypothetical protein
MGKKKKPFKIYNAEEIKKLEVDSYVIQVGVDLYAEDGRFVFTKKAAIVYYNKILNHLLDIIEGGDEEEVMNAHRCLRNLHVMPLRIN